MDLQQIRGQIDTIDGEILRLFEERMELVKGVAQYKRENNLPIFHKDREDQIIQRIGEQASEENEQGAKVLFSTLMNISKCLQQNTVRDYSSQTLSLLETVNSHPAPPEHPVVACPGVIGSYTYLAGKKKFPNAEIRMFERFGDVFDAVQAGEVDCGVLPIENSNAGSVSEVYDLMRSHDFYINHSIRLKINHCLCARPGTRLEDVTEVYSYIQGLAQCSEFICAHNLIKREYSNTAAAAEFVSQSEKPFAAICSAESAQEYGLEILREGIQNIDENYTRFIVISKHLYPNPESDTVATSLTLANAVGSLYNLLTKFAVSGVNLTKIESKPIGNKNFDVIFYLDFTGNVLNESTIHLINDLSNELSGFKFLGNYKYE
ncbi:chorismate mutase [[Clostridium] methylpentosum DSM 5476]|uniref:Bifunctional chorismate mutase/prephenate dehydratase n=1 Tax=[Clostridium] methylpentosum DSM 5476 TaxID=537013 RepID=C0EH76_9FIRM|nr:chorismate mutase [[Clostridium] methylpentosum DSM 5476]MDY3987913.1 prephenate dehydratase domain-containing protein [Massilioclostridium sp.]